MWKGKMGKYSTTINDLVDGHHEHTEDIQWLKDKLADLEERSRRNNVKFRGISESYTAAELLPYVLNIFCILLLEKTEANLTIDRIHCLFKPKHLAEDIHRDVLLRIQFFHVKRRS